MKNLSLFLPTFFALNFSFAQELKLKKGQKFSYEFLSHFDKKGTNSQLSTDFNRIDFDVLKVSAQEFRLKVLQKSNLSYSKSANWENLTDSKEMPKNLVFNKWQYIQHVLSSKPFTITLSKTGKLVKVEGVDSIKAEILRSYNALKVEERGGQSISEALENTFNPSYFFKAYVNRIFNNTSHLKADTTYIEKGEEKSQVYRGKWETVTKKTLDTIHLKKEAQTYKQSLMLKAFFRDSIVTGIYEEESKARKIESKSLARLVYSSKKSIEPESSLLPLFKKLSSYDEFFSPRKEALRAVLGLPEFYRENKGKQDLDAIVQSKLDSLEKFFKPNDFEYLAAKAEVLNGSNYEAYKPLIKQIPLEYFKTGQQVLNKSETLYAENKFEEYTTALKLFFTKFKGDEEYPMNTHNLAGFIHRVIAEEVLSTTDAGKLNQIEKNILGVEKLGIPKLSEMFAGVKLWVQAKQTTDRKKLYDISSRNFNTRYDRFPRYRSLIYQELKNKKVADSVCNSYLDYTIDLLENNLKKLAEKRDDDFMWQYHTEEYGIVTRKYLADAYYEKSRLQPKKELQYLQLAADYSPGQNEQQKYYYVEGEGKYADVKNYNEMYLAKAEKNPGSSEDVLKRYVDLVILQPERYATLRERYAKAYPAGNFKVFFSKALKEKLPQTPAFTLLERAGNKVSTAENAGKFVFIDFWGTWCGACVNEIDKIEDFYKNPALPQNLMVTTIACFDKKQNVDEFMTKRNFTFPVLMSDKMVEKNFKVSSYPTKLLLLPNNSYVIIPFRQDYKELVDKYMAWEL